MSPTVQKVMVYACATVLLLLSLHTTHHCATAAPSSWSEKSASAKLAEDKAAYFSMLQTMLNRLQEARAKRTRADGGFFSRHDAMSDYLQSAYANDLASDLYGPGKRK